MPDFPPLPRRAEPPYVPLDDRAFDRAAALARRRVHRAVAVTSVAAAVAAVATAVPSGRPTSIHVTPAASASAPSAVTASTAADDAPGTGTTPAAATASPSPSTTPPPSQTPEGHEPPPPGYEEPTASESERPDGYVVHTVDSKRQVSYTYPDEPATYEYVAGAAPADCHTEDAWGATTAYEPTYAYDTQRAREFCASFTAPSKVVAGTTAEFAMTICRSGDPTVTAHTLTPRKGERMFSMSALFAADAYHSWGSWAGTTPPGTAVTVQPGDCARWTYQWKAVAEGERHGPLEPGWYEAKPLILAKEFKPECRPEPQGHADGCYAKMFEVTKS